MTTFRYMFRFYFNKWGAPRIESSILSHHLTFVPFFFFKEKLKRTWYTEKKNGVKEKRDQFTRLCVCVSVKNVIIL